MRPWYDRLAVKLVARWFLPLSRAWATALESGGSEARFAADLGLDGLPGGLCGWLLARALTATAELAKVHAGADAHWHDVFFAAAQPGDATMVAAEQRPEEHTSELQSLMRISYAAFCLTKKHIT